LAAVGCNSSEAEAARAAGLKGDSEPVNPSGDLEDEDLARSIAADSRSGRLRLAVHDYIVILEILDSGGRELVALKDDVEVLKENVADLRLAWIWPDCSEGREVTLDADEAQVMNHGLGRRRAL
jgi:hypothetical protein